MYRGHRQLFDYQLTTHTLFLNVFTYGLLNIEKMRLQLIELQRLHQGIVSCFSMHLDNNLLFQCSSPFSSK